MIKVEVKKKHEKIVSVTLTGHANFSEYGQDIVCSAVSALAITTVNSIEKLAKLPLLTEVEEVKGGYLYIEVMKNLTKEQDFITQILLQSLIFGLEDIQAEYPKAVKLVVA